MTSFAQLTTFRIGGPIEHCTTAESDEAVIDAVREGAMVVGGGSNLLVADEPFTRPVVRVATRGIEVQRDGDRVLVEAQAGEPWDELVELAVMNGWSGIDAMSGIPGLVGATPIQNVGAYGQDVSQVISHVTVANAATGEVRTLTGAECGFAYRDSRFKRDGDDVVLAVSFALRAHARTVVQYAELARALGIEVGGSADPQRVRDAVLALRAGKGMVVDPGDPDTRSAGSFFTNPIVDAQVAARIDETCPRYPADAGVKLSAAWLIEQAGITRGWTLDGRARVSSKHTLALVNASGDATAADVLALARAIRDRVEGAYGIRLEAEPTLVGLSLDEPRRASCTSPTATASPTATRPGTRTRA